MSALFGGITARAVQFFAKVRVEESGCFSWLGPVHSKGYGRFGTVLAHRWVYEHARGSIPAGLTIDHLCRNKLCVNPEHLDVVTIAENTRRAIRNPVPPGRCRAPTASLDRAVTSRQLDVLRAIQHFTAAHGYPPAIRELMALLSIRSTNSVFDHLVALERRGVVSRNEKVARSLVVTAKGHELLQAATIEQAVAR